MVLSTFTSVSRWRLFVALWSTTIFRQLNQFIRNLNDDASDIYMEIKFLRRERPSRIELPQQADHQQRTSITIQMQYRRQSRHSATHNSHIFFDRILCYTTKWFSIIYIYNILGLYISAYMQKNDGLFIHAIKPSTDLQ